MLRKSSSRSQSSVQVLGLLTGKPAEPICHLPKSADAGQRTRWLHRHLFPYACDLVFCCYGGAQDRLEAKVELLLAAAGRGRLEGWPFDVGIAGGESAWTGAEIHFGKFHGTLRRAIWPMGRVREPGENILRVARDVNEEFGWHLPTSVIDEVAATIAQTAATPRRSMRRGR